MDYRFINYAPSEGPSTHDHLASDTFQYENDETSDDGLDTTNPGPQFPFFQTSDAALRAAYSYGDPRGGQYPDPTSIYQPSAQPEELVEFRDQSSYLSQPTFQGISQLDSNDPEVDPDYNTASDREDEESQDALSDSGSDTEFPGGRHQSATRGRGRGRGGGRGRGRGRGRGGSKHALEDPQQAIRTRRGANRGGARRGRKGPRAMAEPTEDFKRLNALVTKAYIGQRWDEALRYALEAVKINPEIFPMHGTIAEVLIKKGRTEDALGALFVGVHATRDPEAWRYVIEKLLEIGPGTRETRQRLQDCYSTLLDMDSEDYPARLGRMKNYRNSGQHTRARNECLNLLKRDPYDTEVLGHFAEVCFKLDEPATALPAYEKFFSYCLEQEDPEETKLSWQFLDFYADLLIQLQHWDVALNHIRTVSRWLLGRADETYWDSLADDREWDAEDEPRRIRVSTFSPGMYDVSTYGQGLLIELRAKMGLARLGMGQGQHKEAMHHFEFLEPDDDSEGAYLFEYPELFREIGDFLREAGLHKEALRFYEPLQKVPQVIDSGFCFDIAICYQALGRDEDVKRSIKEWKRKKDPKWYIGYAKLKRNEGKEEDMWNIIRQLKRMGKSDMIRNAGLPLEREGSGRDGSVADGDVDGDGISPTARELSLEHAPRRRYTQRAQRKENKDAYNKEQDAIIASLYNDMVSLRPAVDAGEQAAVDEWTAMADELLLDFREQTLFFPKDKATRFTGYNRWKRTVHLPENEQLLGPEEKEDEIPVQYRTIHFDDWLDVLMQLGIQYAKQGIKETCWDVINVAQSANVFAHDQTRLHLMRNVAMTCALILHDDQRLTEEARWFLKTFPFVSDAYRMFSTVTRFCRGDLSYYNSGPEQKFVLRAVKSMDFALLPPEHRQNFLFTDGDRVKWTVPSKNDGNPYALTEHDPSLLVLYGHMMFVAATYSSALTYYFRAFVLRPEDPVLNLCIAISYVQMGYKRQSDNRQYQIQQGLSFLFRYYDIRTRDNIAIHMQEAEFNVGMMWHSLGLLHLALPAYERCLELSEQVQAEKVSAGGETEVAEDFAAEAAYAIQTILAIGGNFEGARHVTEQHLVL